MPYRSPGLRPTPPPRSLRSLRPIEPRPPSRTVTTFLPKHHQDVKSGEGEDDCDGYNVECIEVTFAPSEGGEGQQEEGEVEAWCGLD